MVGWNQYFLELSESRLERSDIIDLFWYKSDRLLLKLVDLIKLLAFFKLVSNLGRVIAFYGVLLAIIGINMQTVSFPFILIVLMHVSNLI